MFDRGFGSVSLSRSRSGGQKALRRGMNMNEALAVCCA